jgi:hypothetical protein
VKASNYLCLTCRNVRRVPATCCDMASLGEVPRKNASEKTWQRVLALAAAYRRLVTPPDPMTVPSRIVIDNRTQYRTSQLRRLIGVIHEELEHSGHVLTRSVRIHFVYDTIFTRLHDETGFYVLLNRQMPRSEFVVRRLEGDVTPPRHSVTAAAVELWEGLALFSSGGISLCCQP